MYLFLVLIIFVGLLFIVPIISYNNLVSTKNQIEETASNIDVMLKQRYALIPNLLKIVKRYMSYEEKILTEITELRSQLDKRSLSLDKKVEANNKLNDKLSQLNVQAENYPELKANSNFLQVQESLEEVEQQIAAARRTYNAVVKEFNFKLDAFPSKFIASILNYKKKNYIKIEEKAKQELDIDSYL